MSSAEKQQLVAAVLPALRLPAAVTLRMWQDADFAAVQRLSDEAGWSTPRERPAAASEAWRNSWPALVVASDDQVVGFLRAVSDGAVTTYVAELLVDPRWRGQGIGTALLEAAQRLCPGSRLDLLSTEGSGGFYLQTGFRAFPGYRRSWGELTPPAGLSPSTVTMST